MWRVLAIVALVGLLMATGVAGAAPADRIELPVTVTSPDELGVKADSVIVRRGDHLWKISARRLGPDADDDHIAPYWRQVIDVNTPRLRSGDPDLIYPGEVVELPAIPERP
jgi:nucleoid-associated protein YgaU